MRQEPVVGSGKCEHVSRVGRIEETVEKWRGGESEGGDGEGMRE